MGAVVGPHAPIVVSVTLGVFAILIVQEGNNFAQHWRGNRKARAEYRSRKLQREIGANTLIRNKIFEPCIGRDAGGSVELHALVDAFADHLAHCRVEMGLRQRLA
jgi:hypothetical protein